MKKITINYIYSLASYLDSENIRWDTLMSTDKQDMITIWYKTEEELFELAYNFGIFTEKNES